MSIKVVTGFLNGRFVSVLLRDEKSRHHARAYGWRKGWTDIRVIQAVALAVGLFTGIAADRAQAADAPTEQQTDAMGASAVDIVAASRCPGITLKDRTFARLAQNDMTLNDVSSTRGKFYPIFYTVVQAVNDRADNDPAGFCQRVRAGQSKQGY